MGKASLPRKDRPSSKLPPGLPKLRKGNYARRDKITTPLRESARGIVTMDLPKSPYEGTGKYEAFIRDIVEHRVDTSAVDANESLVEVVMTAAKDVAEHTADFDGAMLLITLLSKFSSVAAETLAASPSGFVEVFIDCLDTQYWEHVATAIINLSCNSVRFAQRASQSVPALFKIVVGAPRSKIAVYVFRFLEVLASSCGCFTQSAIDDLIEFCLEARAHVSEEAFSALHTVMTRVGARYTRYALPHFLRVMESIDLDSEITDVLRMIGGLSESDDPCVDALFDAGVCDFFTQVLLKGYDAEVVIVLRASWNFCRELGPRALKILSPEFIGALTHLDTSNPQVAREFCDLVNIAAPGFSDRLFSKALLHHLVVAGADKTLETQTNVAIAIFAFSKANLKETRAAFTGEVEQVFDDYYLNSDSPTLADLSRKVVEAIFEEEIRADPPPADPRPEGDMADFAVLMVEEADASDDEFNF